MSVPEREVIAMMERVLVTVLRRQGELEARCKLLEDHLGLQHRQGRPPDDGAAQPVQATAHEASGADPIAAQGVAPPPRLLAIPAISHGAVLPREQTPDLAAQPADSLVTAVVPPPGVASPRLDAMAGSQGTARPAGATDAIATLAANAATARAPLDAPPLHNALAEVSPGLAAPLPTAHPPASSPPGSDAPSRGAAALAETRATAASSEAPSLESQVGLKWLNRIGVVTLLLGVAFAYKTAVDNDWIGPGARIALGVLTALVTLAIGDIQWRRQHVVFAQGLTGLGVALLYVTFWAAFSLYELAPQPVAFGLMVATTIAAGLLALRYASQAIAVLALLGGYLTPIALATGESHSIIFLGYVTVLNIATIVLARRRVWPVLELLAAAATSVLYGGWLATNPAFAAERPIATVFAAVFYAQYAVARSRVPWQLAQAAAPILMAALWGEAGLRLALLLAFALAGLVVAERRPARAAALWVGLWFWAPELAHTAVDLPPLAVELTGSALGFAGFVAWILWAHVRGRRPLGGFDLVLLTGTPLAFAASVASVLEPHHRAALGGIVLLVAVVYLALGKLVWDAADPARGRRPAALAIGAALVFITAAVPLELSGFWLAIAWGLEGVGLAWLSARFTEGKLGLAACAVTALALGALGFATVEADLGEPLAYLVNLRLATFAALATGLFVIARLLREPHWASVTYVLGHALVLLAVPCELAGFWIAIAWAVLGAGLAWLSARRTDDRLSLAACTALTCALGATFVYSLQAELADHLAVLANLRFATFVVLAGSLFAAARLLSEPIRATIAYVVAHLVVMIAVGLETASWISQAVAEDARSNTMTVATSILIAGYGVMLIVLGVVRRRARDRIMGLVLMAAVVLKLYGSDVWSLGRGFQVAAFLMLGVLLLGVSYVYSRYRSVIGRLWKDDPPTQA